MADGGAYAVPEVLDERADGELTCRAVRPGVMGHGYLSAEGGQPHDEWFRRGERLGPDSWDREVPGSVVRR